METAKAEVLIRNENLYRAVVSAPIAILFVLLAVNAISNSGMIFMKLVFICMAIYFTLSTLAYAAFCTNEHHNELTERTIENRHLLRVLLNAPAAAAFIYFSYITIASSSHSVLIGGIVCITCYFTLKTLAHAAFYTNECFDH